MPRIENLLPAFWTRAAQAALEALWSDRLHDDPWADPTDEGWLRDAIANTCDRFWPSDDPTDPYFATRLYTADWCREAEDAILDWALAAIETEWPEVER